MTNENAEIGTVIDTPTERHVWLWYPQMGGYVAKALVSFERTDRTDGPGCFAAEVYHDGEFPFAEGDRAPMLLHHCAAEQFISFGLDVLEQQAAVHALTDDDRARLSVVAARLSALLGKP